MQGAQIGAGVSAPCPLTLTTGCDRDVFDYSNVDRSTTNQASKNQNGTAPLPDSPFNSVNLLPRLNSLPCSHNPTKLLLITQAVRVATQYASAPCKLTISSQLFARWPCRSGITISSYLFAAKWHLLQYVGYLRHQQQVDL